jgi:LCP family protein required for cell wall assembly
MNGRLGAPSQRGSSESGSSTGDYNPLFDSSPPSRWSGSEPEPSSEPPAPPAKPRHRKLRIAGVTALIVLLVLGMAAGSLYLSLQQFSSNIGRVPDVFSTLDEAERPSFSADRESFLVMGTDSRNRAVQRSDDVLMLARMDVYLDADATRASVVSIPRDSWVPIPEHGTNKIAAAYGYGGPSLLVLTVEKLTNVRIDHFVIIDFAGFQSMVDAVGGIDVTLNTATSSDGIQFVGGVNHLDGRSALAYVSNGPAGPAGYADRLTRQQTALRALLEKVASAGLLTEPVQLFRLLDALSAALRVDETLSNAAMQQLALQMRGLRPKDVQFLVSPVRGLGREGGQSVVYLDDARSAELWGALREGRVETYVQRYPDSLLPAGPR